MNSPSFFSDPGRWRAEGSIQLPLGLKDLPFHALWEGHGPYWVQQVFLEGVNEPVVNAYRRLEEDHPVILLESPHLGSFEASLSESPTQVGWEIKTEALDGYELFTRQEDGSYLHQAEFTGEHGMRTRIRSTLKWERPS